MDKALLCVSASAGSGKTYKLVWRYIELLFLGAKPSSILTLTFTKKAAKEMEERIIKEIQSIYRHRNDDNFIKKVESNIDNNGILVKQIQERISFIYQSFLKEDLKITTIDAFFQKILRSLCWYVGVEYDFKIKQDNLEVITENFLKLLSNEESKEVLELCYEKREQGLQSVLRLCEFLDFFKEMLDESLFVSSIFKGDYEQEALAYARGIQESYYAQKGELHEQLKFDDFMTLLSKCETWILKENLREYRGFSKILFNDEDFIGLKKAISGVFLEQETLYLQRFYKVFKVYLKAKEQYYAENNLLSFNAVSSKVYKLLSNKNFPKDFLYFRLDSVISHILIDEFQDTSILQYEILKPLIEEIKAGIGSRQFLRSFFYVGDIKQSIYRFRGGNPELFKIASKQMQQENMKKNYRSARHIVEFVNATFDGKIEGFIPQIPMIEKEGYVRVCGCEVLEEEVYLSIVKMLEYGVNPSDITLLVFDNKSVVELATFLQERGLRVVMDTSTKLIFHNEVRALIQFLKFLDTKNPMFQKEFFMLLGLEEESLEEFLKTVNNPINNPAEILLSLMQKFGIASLSAKRFLEVALEFATIKELLDGVETLQEEIVSSDFSGIRIMTIHKSKGLEFENVFIIDRKSSRNAISNGLFFDFGDDGVSIKRIFKYDNHKRSAIRMSLDENYKDAFLKEKDLAKKDLKNQLYVALTRAKQTMQIFYGLKNSQSAFEEIGLKDEERGEFIKSLEPTNSKIVIPESAFEYPHRAMLENLGRQEQIQVAQKEALQGDIQALSFGIALHFAMEQKLKNHLEDALLLEILRNKEGFYLSQKSLQEILKKCNLLLKNHQFNEILQKGSVKCEVSFLSNGRQKRLDLLVENEEEAFIIDYKSGQPNSAYEIQMREYMQSVTMILKKRVYGYIFYTQDSGRLVKIV
ncbi:RecB-like helicase [Helicobacter mesocricetorum]|uniref:RecB-like helicase n=1 Tax=Helicobacter mesocricetorum TaxID=87012 RepID=UPI000CF0A483|nr:RecB-like helicase [Helicobacter mesocricetorum]